MREWIEILTAKWKTRWKKLCLPLVREWIEIFTIRSKNLSQWCLPQKRERIGMLNGSFSKHPLVVSSSGEGTV